LVLFEKHRNRDNHIRCELEYSRDLNNRPRWVWVPFDGWEKTWSGTCGIPEAGYSAGEWVGIPTWEETARAAEEVAATAAAFSFLAL